MIKKVVFSFLFFTTLSIFGQKEKINSYKYLIVPDKFEFLKSTDQYQTSSLTKFLLKKKGFNVFLSNENLPQELIKNRCLALIATVIDNSNMFTFKSKIEIKDCNGNILYASKIGKSKEKNYKKGHHESIRRAFDTMGDLEYNYKPNKVVVSNAEIVKNEITKPIKKVIPDVKEITLIKENVPVKKNIISKEVSELNTNLETLYAQAKENGYQLVNTTPSIVFQILKTKVKHVFIIKDKNGILYKDANSWTAEYYKNNTLVVKKYNIKF